MKLLITLFILLNLLLISALPVMADDAEDCLRATRSLFVNANASNLAKIGEMDGELLIKEYDKLISSQDLFSYKGDKELSKQVNEVTLKYLDTPLKSAHPNRLSGINRWLASQMHKGVDNHPVASQMKLCKYDPNDQGIGFCFGRAMAAHLEAVKRGVQNDHIKKLFAVGTFENGAGTWRYHVTTIVKADDDSWWAIDPVFSKPLKIKDWMKKMQKMNPHGDMEVFATEARRFGPDSPATYQKSGSLFIDFFNNYFTDLLESYRRVDGFSGPRVYPNGN